MVNTELSDSIKNKALALGYDRCGIIPAEPNEDYTRYLEQRMADFPESVHLYEMLRSYAYPPENMKSIVVCARRYNQYRKFPNLDNRIGKLYLFDGRLDFAPEYQAKVGVEACFDELGIAYEYDIVSARWAAKNAGIGFFGRNNFIYTDFGSYVWIDVWTVDAELGFNPSDQPIRQKSLCNDNCRKCIDACPTKALSGDFSMDRGKCIAHLSFFSTQAQPERFRDDMGVWLYGCDVCQDVCPMNHGKFEQTTDFPRMAETEEQITLEKILALDEEYFTTVLNPRFWYIGKKRTWLWKCNALRAMANLGDPKYHELIRKACGDENEHVREIAEWACKKVGI